MTELMKIKGIGPAISKKLSQLGIVGLADLAVAKIDDIVAIRGVTSAKAEAFRAQAAGLSNSAETSAPEAEKPEKKTKDGKKKSKKKAVEKFEKALKKAAKKAAKKTAKKAKKSKKSGSKKKD